MIAVRLEVSADRHTAERGRRSSTKRPTISAVRCWASAALPPLPAAINRPPPPRTWASRRPHKSSTCASCCSPDNAADSSATCFINQTLVLKDHAPLLARPSYRFPGRRQVPAADRLQVGALGVAGDAAPAVSRHRAQPGRATEPRAHPPVVEQPADGNHERGAVTGRYQESGDTVVNGVQQAADRAA